MPKFVLIVGPQAVGKMTVGQELEKLTGLTLMHNHETLDLVSKFFDFNNHKKKLREISDLFRFTIFEEVAKSDLEGMIFTLMLCLEREEDIEYVEKIEKIYKENNGEFYVVELEADLKERLRRNKTENRLKHKPGKRDLVFSENNLLGDVEKHKLNTDDDEVLNFENYIKINNTDISAKETARMIKEKFEL